MYIPIVFQIIVHSPGQSFKTLNSLLQDDALVIKPEELREFAEEERKFKPPLPAVISVYFKFSHSDENG